MLQTPPFGDSVNLGPSVYYIQPYATGADRGREATIVSTHDSVEAAYAELEPDCGSIE
jgi:hypothetical protein